MGNLIPGAGPGALQCSFEVSSPPTDRATMSDLILAESSIGSVTSRNSLLLLRPHSSCCGVLFVCAVKIQSHTPNSHGHHHIFSPRGASSEDPRTFQPFLNKPTSCLGKQAELSLVEKSRTGTSAGLPEVVKIFVLCG